MKKGYWLIVLSLMLVSMGFGRAAVCVDGSAPECVCDHTPNSNLGYGQVIIGLSTYSCNNIADGLCPEDFVDAVSGLVANCSSCADPDCTGTISGTVRNILGDPIDRVTVNGGPLRYNMSASSLERSTLTNFNGQYSGSFITGTYTLQASKDGYDSDTKMVTVLRNAPTTVDFILPNGTCHDDCTNSFGRCSAACHGVEFNESNTRCWFYNDTVRTACNNKMKGTEVFLGMNGTDQGIFIQCCGDDPVNNPFEQPYTKYYASINTSTTTCDVQNAIKIEKIATYNDIPVRVIITYWE